MATGFTPAKRKQKQSSCKIKRKKRNGSTHVHGRGEGWRCLVSVCWPRAGHGLNGDRRPRSRCFLPALDRGAALLDPASMASAVEGAGARGRQGYGGVREVRAEGEGCGFGASRQPPAVTAPEKNANRKKCGG